MLLISYRKEDINENKQYEYSFWYLMCIIISTCSLITFTDMFWYLPGFLSCYCQWFPSVVGLMSSSKAFNGITLFLTIIFFFIFQVHITCLERKRFYIILI